MNYYSVTDIWTLISIRSPACIDMYVLRRVGCLCWNTVSSCLLVCQILSKPIGPVRHGDQADILSTKAPVPSGRNSGHLTQKRNKKNLATLKI
jgi:hypothetical protein